MLRWTGIILCQNSPSITKKVCSRYVILRGFCDARLVAALAVTLTVLAQCLFSDFCWVHFYSPKNTLELKPCAKSLMFTGCSLSLCDSVPRLCASPPPFHAQNNQHESVISTETSLCTVEGGKKWGLAFIKKSGYSFNWECLCDCWLNVMLKCHQG